MDGNGRTHLDQTRIMLRPIGSGLPLGFYAFGIGMLLLACLAIGWIPIAEQKNVGTMLVTFVFPLELIGTIMAFLARDTLSATTLGLFSASWLSLGLSLASAAPGTRSITTAVYLFGFATAVVLIAALATMGKPFFTLLLSIAAARMVLDGVYETGSSHVWSTVSGGCGIALAALSMYGGTALALEDAHRRDPLPLFRRGNAKRAFVGDYREQLEQLATEPGVRQQL